MKKLKVGILGATGSAGMEFVNALYNHPWFEIGDLYASGKNEGKPFYEATTFDTAHLPVQIKEMKVRSLDRIEESDIICSALPSDIAKEMEARSAAHTPVISTTSAHRYEDDVPIMLELNIDHYPLLERQKERGWNYWVAPGPNCTTVGLAEALAPIDRGFGIRRVLMSSYQAVSGGGYSLVQKWKEQISSDVPEPFDIDPPSEDTELILQGNVIGHIKDEEPKVRKETKKILGRYVGSRIIPAYFKIDCSCARVPILTGHFENIMVETAKRCAPDDVKKAYHETNEYYAERFGGLPSTPKQTFYVLDRSPQPRHDAMAGGGMSIVVGRIEKCDAFDDGYGIKLQVLSNNLVKGAAKGMVQVAEYLVRDGFLGAK